MHAALSVNGYSVSPIGKFTAGRRANFSEVQLIGKVASEIPALVSMPKS